MGEEGRGEEGVLEFELKIGEGKLPAACSSRLSERYAAESANSLQDEEPRRKRAQGNDEGNHLESLESWSGKLGDVSGLDD